MKQLVLVRHGETEWNAARRLQGQTDIALSDIGRSQAKALAPVIARIRPDIAVTSDLSRAAETASLLGAEARREPGFREQDLGNWSGQEIDLLLEKDPELYHRWRAGDFIPPGGESWTEFRERVADNIEAVKRETQLTGLVVCHGGVIRAALDALLDLRPSKIIPVGPGSLSIVSFDEGAPRLAAFNLRPGSIETQAPD